MPLIKCPDCKHQVSTLAPTCPQCGRPITGTSIVKKKVVKKKVVKKKVVKKKVKRKPRGAIGWNPKTGKALSYVKNVKKRPRPLHDARMAGNSTKTKSAKVSYSDNKEEELRVSYKPNKLVDLLEDIWVAVFSLAFIFFIIWSMKNVIEDPASAVRAIKMFLFKSIDYP